MNTKQRDAWKDLVLQCKTQTASRFYSSINVASQVRSDAIVAADALVELVTPELAALLKRLSGCTLPNTFGDLHASYQCIKDRKDARAFAARIREALEVNNED